MNSHSMQLVLSNYAGTIKTTFRYLPHRKKMSFDYSQCGRYLNVVIRPGKQET
jgi:hypothetical protein